MSPKDFPKLGPKKRSDIKPGERCLACLKAFRAGQYTTLVPVGPGEDPEKRAAARARREYDAIGIEVHYACATGIED